MNIGSVSFTSSKVINYNKRTQEEYKKEKKDNSTKKNTQRSMQNATNLHLPKIPLKKKTKFALKCYLAGVASIFSLNTANSYLNTPKDISVIPYESNRDINELARTYNSSEAAITNYNNLDSYPGKTDLSKLSIPSLYSNVDDKIKELQEDLFSKRLSNNKREKIETELHQYLQKRDIQNSIAEAYTDGDYVYFYIKDVPANEDGINVEKFKKIFDIKDGAIKDNNPIGYTWRINEDNGSGYKDFTTANLHPHEIIKVEKKDIKTKNLSFDYSID